MKSWFDLVIKVFIELEHKNFYLLGGNETLLGGGVYWGGNFPGGRWLVNIQLVRGPPIPSVGKVACSYHCPDQLQLLLGHWQAKKPWSSWDLQKPDLLEILSIYQWLLMSTEWEFAFPNTAIIIFCLIYFFDILLNVMPIVTTKKRSH